MRLNKLRLCDLSGEICSLDDGIQVRPGTVVALTDPRGITVKKCESFQRAGRTGNTSTSASEHDNAAYSDTVVATPPSPDTSTPLPNNPPLITGLTITESFVPDYNGSGVTRFFVSWDAPVFPFLAGYWVEVWVGSQIIDSAPVSGTKYASPPVVGGSTYAINVATLSSIAQSASVSDSMCRPGKTVPAKRRAILQWI